MRVIDLGSGVITTFAGTGKGAHAGDGGPAASADVFGARAVALAPDDSLYVMERQGSSIRRIHNGIIETVAGTGARGYAGDGHDARQAVFDAPKEMAVDPAGNIFIVDTENHVIRLIDAQTLDRHHDRRQRQGRSCMRWRDRTALSSDRMAPCTLAIRRTTACAGWCGAVDLSPGHCEERSDEASSMKRAHLTGDCFVGFASSQSHGTLASEKQCDICA